MGKEKDFEFLPGEMVMHFLRAEESREELAYETRRPVLF